MTCERAAIVGEAGEYSARVAIAVGILEIAFLESVPG